MEFCTNCGSRIEDAYDFCPECGTAIAVTSFSRKNENCANENHDTYTAICEQCGEKIPESSLYCMNCGAFCDGDSNESFESVKNRIDRQFGVWKNKWVALGLCVFFGWFGAHKFYEGKTVLGIVYMFTFGAFCVGWLVDIILLIRKPNPYRVRWQ